jgi:hypothetical protein
MGGWSYRKAANEFSLMEAPEVHILIQQSWQLFGTFIFRDEVMSTARRFNMFFAWLRQSAKQFRVYFPVFHGVCGWKMAN